MSSALLLEQQALEELEELIEAGRRTGIIANVPEEYEIAPGRKAMDPVSDTLNLIIQEITIELESFGNTANSNVRSTWVPKFIDRLFSVSKEKGIQARLKDARELLERTVGRRKPHATVYKLAFHSRLFENSFSTSDLYRTIDGVIIPNQVSDQVRARHRELEEWSKSLVETYEGIQEISDAIPITLSAVVESLFRVFEKALHIELRGKYFLEDKLLQILSRIRWETRRFDMEVILFTISGYKDAITQEDVDYLSRLGENMERRLDSFSAVQRRNEIMPDSKIELWRRSSLEVQKKLKEEMGTWLMIIDILQRTVQRQAAETARAGFEVAHMRSHGGDVASCATHYFTKDILLPKGLKILSRESLRGNRIIGCAKGGFAQVYFVELKDPLKIKHQGTPVEENREVHKVAVKIIQALAASSDDKILPMRELIIWCRLEHENILPFLGLWMDFEYGPSLRGVSLVSPLMERGNLLNYIQENPSTSTNQRLLFLYNVSNALAYSEPLLILLGNKLTLQIVHNHEYRLVHGDVKADNVLVGEDRAYLSDFGSSVALYDVSGASSSNAGGNWRYKAPELLEVTNTVHITPETDVYAFGCLALEVFTGSAPWDGLKESEGLSKKMRCQYPGRPRQSIGNDNLWFLMLECWKEAPTLRPTTRDLCIRLEDMLVASSSGHWQ